MMNDDELKRFLREQQEKYEAERDALFRETRENCATREEFEQFICARLTSCACMGCPKENWRDCECVTPDHRGCRCMCKLEPYASNRRKRQDEVRATVEKYWPAESQSS